MDKSIKSVVTILIPCTTCEASGIDPKDPSTLMLSYDRMRWPEPARCPCCDGYGWHGPEPEYSDSGKFLGFNFYTRRCLE